MSTTDPYAAASTAKQEIVPVEETPKAIEPVVPVESEKTTEQVPQGSNVDEVLEWVGNDKDRAKVALETEQSATKPRKTLVEKLKELV